MEDTLSARKHADLESQQQIARLLRANEDLMQFAYAVSHDLQAPLRTVTSVSQLLALKYNAQLDDQAGDYLQVIVDAGSRMTAMIHDLLELAKYAGDEPSFGGPISLEKALADALENLRIAIQDTNAVITHDPLPAVAGDTGQFSQLFQNLVGNSLKYRQPGTDPHVHVSAKRNGTEWIIAVRDDGIGFEASQAEQIFKVFKRLAGTDAPGTGIGLAICKRIVERRGGKIWADGRPGEGAVFCFSIPDEIEEPLPQPSNARFASESLQIDVANLTAGPFDELFHTLDLAQAMVRDLDGRILIWTEGAARLFGWSKREALGQRAPELLKTEFPNPLPEIEAELLRKGEWRGTLKKFKRDGCPLWLVCHWVLYRDGSGRPQSVIEVLNDITALKETEAALVRSSQQRDLALNAGQMGVWRWDSRTGGVEWSATLESIMGMAPGSFEGTFEAAVKRTYPDDLPLLNARIAEAFEGGTEYTVEFRMFREDGSICWVRSQGNVILDERNQPVGLMGVVWDITHRKQNDSDREFLLAFSTQLGQSSDAESLSQMATAELGEYLAASTCRYIEISQASGNWEFVAGYNAQKTAEAPTGNVFNFGEHLSDLQTNRIVVIDDAAADTRTAKDYITTYLPLEVRAALIVPLHREGQLCAALVLTDKTARQWHQREIEVARGVADRLWPQLENARLLRVTKESRAQWLETAERLSVATSAAQLGVFVWDVSEDRAYWENQRMYEITGRNREQGPLNKADFLQKLIHPDDAAGFEKSVTEALLGDGSYRYQCRICRSDGATRWIEFSGQFDLAPDGAPTRLVGVMADITNRIEAEQLSHEQDLQLRRMIDSIDQLAWIAKPDGYIFWYNQRWYDYTGTTPQQMEGWGWQSVHDPKVLPQVMSRWTASIRTGEPFDMMFPLRGDDGVYRSFLTRIVPVRDSLGNIVRWFGTNTNVDAIRIEQDLLKESERRFRELAESVSELVWVSDSQGKITYSNPQWYSYTGLLHHQALGDNWVPILHPDDAANVLQLWKSAVASGKRYDSEARVRRHDGSYRWFLNRAEPVKDDHGNVVRWLGTSTDIHEQKLTEQELRRSNEDLEQFAYAASHDLQEPLRTVAIFSQLLSQRYGDKTEETERFTRYIVSAATRMDELLAGIMAYSRAGASSELLAPSDSRYALDIAIGNLDTAIAEAGATITRADLPTVIFPQDELIQVFQNLLGNALKFRAARAPQVHVSAVREGRWQRFSVADNGIGINQDYLERIFGVFKRLHKDEYPGVGIGLAICKRIVERRGGRIWAESELDKGTTFYFTVPADERLPN